MHPTGETIIAGKYRLLQKLGEGGMGSVWRAQHIPLDSPVAIKLIDPALASTTDALSRFLCEARAAASLRSPHVVQILDHGVDEGTPYIAMELLEGETLGQRLARVGKLPPSDTARMLVQVGRAVRRAHDAGIVHRDLKPDNVFIVHNDDDEIAKVLDFGIAKLNRGIDGAPSTGATRTGALLGTPDYMSPEQIEGDRSLDYRSDIWSLGVIAFECLVGRRPFDAESIGSLILAICSRPMPVPSNYGPVPTGFDAWFARACCREPDERFTSAREACSELKGVCDGNLALTPISNSEPPPTIRNDGAPSEPRISSKSLAAVSASQRSAPRPTFIRARWPLLIAAGLLITVGIAWGVSGRSRPPSVASARAALSHAPAAGTIVVVPAGAPPTADANRSRVISVDSIPMEPAPNPMPVAGKVARPAPSASAKLAPLKIDLDAPRPTPQRDRDSLPENPYKH